MTATASILEAYTCRCAVTDAAHLALRGHASDALMETLDDLASTLTEELDANGEYRRGQLSAERISAAEQAVTSLL